MENVLNMRIFYHILGCDTLNLHQLWTSSINVLVTITYHLIFVPFVLVVLVPDTPLLGQGTAIVFNWILAL